jgi:hypothetical protein
MIKIIHILNTLTQHDISKPELVEYSQRTVAEYAKDGAQACIYDGRNYKRGEWDFVPRDGSELTFVYSHGDPVGLVGQLASLGSMLSNVQSSLGLFGLPSPIGTSDPFYRFGERTRQKAMGFIGGLLTGGSIPSTGFSTGGGASSAYGSSRPVNSTEAGTIIPHVMGEYITAGMVLRNTYEAVNGELHFKTLLGLGYGPFSQMGKGSVVCTADQDNLTGTAIPNGLYLGDREARDLEDVTVHLRTGNSTQTVCPGFEHNGINYTDNVRLNQGIVYKRTTSDPVHELHVHLSFPQGLRSLMRKDGTVAEFWIKVAVRIYTTADVLVTTLEETVKATRTEAFYHTIKLPNLTFQKYKVQVERTEIKDPESSNIDQEDNETRRVYNCDVVGVTEYNYFPVAYRGIALLAMEYRASEQLSGGEQKRIVCRGRKVYNPDAATINVEDATNATPIAITATGHGLVTDDYVTVAGVGGNTAADGEWPVRRLDDDTFELVGSVGNGAYTSGGTISPWEFSQNNALLVRDFATNKVYGGGRRITPGNVDATELGDYADFCDESIETYPGSGENEARFQFNGILDTSQSLWSVVLRICRNSRCVPTRIGDTLGFVLEEVKATTQKFAQDVNVEGDGPEISYQALTTRPNLVTVNYTDTDLWEQRRTPPAQLPADQIKGGIVPLEIDDWGNTRRTQAMRRAAFELARASKTLKAVRLEAGLDTLNCRPGTIIETARKVGRIVGAGRVVSSTSTSRVLDRSVTLGTGVVYAYTERYGNSEFTTIRIDGTGTTSSTLNIAAGLPAGTANGRLWDIIREGEAREQFMVQTIRYLDGGKRQVEGSQYLGAEVLNDNSADNAAGYFVPAIPSAPPEVTNLAAANEAFSRMGHSTFDLTWTAAAGAERYLIYYRSVSRDTAFQKIGETTTNSATAEVKTLFGERIEFAVVALGAYGAGGTTAISSLGTGARVEVNSDRDDEYQCVADFPDNVTGVTMTAGSDTDATLSWDAVAGADGYVAKLNNWHGGYQIYDGTGTSVAVKVCNLVRGYGVRAYKNVTGGDGRTVRYYSQEFVKASSAAAVPTGWNTATADFFQRFTTAGIELQNLHMIEYVEGSFGNAVKQVDQNLPCVFMSDVLDGGSTRNYFISLDVRVTPYPLGGADTAFLSMAHACWTGIINKDYHTVKIELLYSNSLEDGQLSAPGSMDVSALQMTDLYINARYIRLKVTVRMNDNYDRTFGDVAAFVERAAIQIHAPT